MTKRRMGIWGSAVTLLLCLSPYGCDKSGGDESGSGKKAPPPAATSAEKAPPATATSADKAPPASTKLFEDPSGALADVQKKIGRDKLMVLQLIIFPTHLDIQVQSSNEKESFDEYKWKDGKVAGPTPVTLSGSDAVNPSKNVFDLSEADLGAVAKIAEDVKKRVDVEGGKLTHILLKRNAGIGNNPKFRVYISGSREHVSATYDVKGTFKKVWK